MNLAKLYEAQAKLDADIIEKKGLQGRNLLPNKILALNVELGELAQEVQGEWKYWKEHTTRDNARVLDEYVDGIHFLLSIGNDIEFNAYHLIGKIEITCGIVDAFISAQSYIGDLDRLLSRNTLKNNKHIIYSTVFENYLLLGERLGFNDDQIEAAYFKKNKVNHARQVNDY